MEFKVGDLITGIDRSFKRSIYRVEEFYDIDNGHFILRIICFNGRLFIKPEKIERRREEFRLATSDETHREMSDALRGHLCTITKRLISYGR